jgi:hypothetical protein
MITTSERAKTVHAFDRATTFTGLELLGGQTVNIPPSQQINSFNNKSVYHGDILTENGFLKICGMERTN